MGNRDRVVADVENVTGSPRVDYLFGSGQPTPRRRPYADKIGGKGGDDTILGKGGEDVMRGGPGADHSSVART